MESNDEQNSNWLTSQETAQMASILVGGGILGSIYLLIKKVRNPFSWIIPLGMIAAGIDLFLKDREQRIKQTGDQIMSQLDELDPIARAKVVKYLADKEMDKLS